MGGAKGILDGFLPVMLSGGKRRGYIFLILYLPLFINDAIPEEHKNGIDMRRDMLRRSHVLVVCGDEVDEDVKNDIAVAKRLNITATTLDGILTVNQQGRHDV